MSYEYNNQGSSNGQSSLSGEAILAEKAAQAQKEKLKKKYRITSLALIGVIVAAVAALLMTQLNSGPPEQLEWSEWMETLPDYATEEVYNIEKQTLYRTRQLETTSSTMETSKSGWELYDTVVGTGDFGPWSDWSTSQVSAGENREVETQTRYRYRDKETTSGAASTMSGWELYDTTYTWGDYGSWSSWSSSSVSGSDSRDVESKKQYSYRTKEYTTSSNSSMSGWTRFDSSTSYGSWSSWSTTPVSSSSTRDVETKQVQSGAKYSLGHYCTGNVSGAQWMTAFRWPTSNEVFNQNCVFHNLGWYDSLDDFKWRDDGGGYVYYPNGEKYRCSNSCWTWYIYEEEPVYETQYRSRSVSTTYYFYRWSDWSDYSDSRVSSSSSDREVITRTLYRYRDRQSIPTYHLWRWGGWTDWSTNAVSSSNNRQVETSTYYRYRDRQLVTTYYFQRWSDWSEYTTKSTAASDTVEVETITQYRFKSKGK